MRVIVPALLASAMLLASVPAVLPAQEVVQALPGTTDADRLAEQMRALAANPRDLEALIAAADLSLSLDDLSGAASLFARAEKVSPRDPRIKAGEGAILVRSERPGEALRYFAQAEAAGYDVRRYAADRGLAYDLIGQQERAQRDYRLALKDRADDEVIKRYALSLGISGQREAALQQLDPLVRKQDRSAWRVRAFVLAMNGDQAAAEKIVTTMLPQGMAQGLLPFFQRLPALPAADRAFAVHFGEVRPSPERIADARLAPVLPQLAPERPVALASVQPAQQRPGARETRRGGRGRAAAPAVAVASTPPQPSYQAATAALARVQPVPQERAPVALASTAATVQPLPVRTPTAGAPVATPTPAPSTPAPVRTAMTVNPAPAQATPAPAPTTVAPITLAAAPAPMASAAPTTALTNATPAPGFATEVVQPLPAARPTEVAAAAPAANFSAPPSRSEADSVLARIVAGLSIPAAELGVVEPVRAAPPPLPTKTDTAARVLAEAKAKEERDAAAEKALALQAAADKRAADRKALADKKAAAAKKLVDDKAAAAKKEAAAKKLAEAKEAAEAKKLARANPERIWVQVAGGAYQGDLPKAYASVKAKAPTAFGSRPAWTTPLRATNRVLIGPFKTDAEARAQVNTLAKAGVPAFTFTSDAGQVVTKLPAK